MGPMGKCAILNSVQWTNKQDPVETHSTGLMGVSSDTYAGNVYGFLTLVFHCIFGQVPFNGSLYGHLQISCSFLRGN